MRATFYICCVLYFGASFSIPPLIAMGSTGVLAGGYIIFSKRATRLAFHCWPLLVMCAIALMSAAWSVDPSVTVRRSFQLLFGCLLGIAMVGRVGSAEAIKIIVRTMAFGCLLSVVWVVAFPDVAVHQATDQAQTVHAGLWRGILSHKVDLGIFAGLTLALLLFYGPKVSGSPMSYLLGLASSIACLAGSGSATGVVVAATLFFTFRLTYANANQPLKIRRKLTRTLVMFLVVWIALTTSGLFDQMASMLGRSSDLTGRATYWPYVMAFLNTGNWVLGYGYAAGFKFVARLIAEEADLALGEAHNGYIEMLVAFGYTGGVVVIVLHLLMFWQAAQLQINSPARAAKVAAFPIAIMTVLLITAYIESVILAPAGIFAVLLPIVAAVRAEGLMAAKAERRRAALIAAVRRAQSPRVAAPPLVRIVHSRNSASVLAGADSA